MQARQAIEKRATEAAAPGTAAQGDAIGPVVRSALAAQNHQLVLEIGSRAAPYVAAAMLEDTEQFPTSHHLDPIHLLIQLSERKAATLLLENLDAGGYLWKRRIVRAMENGAVLRNTGTWSSTDTESPPVCLEPEWLAVLERLLASPDVAREALGLVRDVYLRDNLTPALQQALVGGMRSDDGDYVKDVIRILNAGGVVATEKPVLEDACTSSDSGVRKFAARRLLEFPESAALRALHADPDPEVRILVAESFGSRKGRALNMQSDGSINTSNYRWISIRPTLAAADLAILRALIADANAEVRDAAAWSLVGLDPPLDDDIYLQLVDHHDASLRIELAKNEKIPSSIVCDLLLHLAEDSNPDIRRRVDTRLKNAPLGSDLATYLPALKKRVQLTLPTLTSDLEQALHHAMESGTGAGVLVDWALDAGDDTLLGHVLHQARFSRRTDGARRRITEDLMALEDARLAELFARAYALGNKRHEALEKEIRVAQPPRYAAMRLVLANPSYTPYARLEAASLAAPGGGAEFVAGMRSLCTDPYWKGHVLTREGTKRLWEFAGSLPNAESNEILLALAGTPGVADELLEPLVSRYETAAPKAKEVTLMVLGRWFRTDGPALDSVKRALGHLRSLPADADAELLIRATRLEGYARTAIQTMGGLRHASFVDPLGACLEAGWILDWNERQRVQVAAAEALTGFLSDDAARWLLHGIRLGPKNPAYDACQLGINALREYRTQAAWLESQGTAPLTRAGAIGELLGMLKDADATIRAEAALGLGTLGASEAIPTLIRLLKDDAEGVRKAARAALDRLNREAAKSGAGQGSDG